MIAKSLRPAKRTVALENELSMSGLVFTSRLLIRSETTKFTDWWKEESNIGILVLEASVLEYPMKTERKRPKRRMKAIIALKKKASKSRAPNLNAQSVEPQKFNPIVQCLQRLCKFKAPLRIAIHW
jgi:hypothetical protein